MRKLGFFTYKLPSVIDGNAESYDKGERTTGVLDRVTAAAAAAGRESLIEGGGGAPKKINSLAAPMA